MTRAAAGPDAPTLVRVHAPARLHLGMVDVAGGSRRRFGGIGVGIEGPRVVVEAYRADAFGAEGPSAERALGFARDAANGLGLPGAVHVTVREAIAGHHGLGSGTKLGLAVGRACADLHGLAPATPDLALAVGRGRRSAIGVWTFDGPGLVLEGGPHADDGAPGPLLGRWPMPADWRCVLAIPHGAPGVSGDEEERFFDADPDGDAGGIAQQVVTALLPGLVDGDVAEFGAALSEVQRLVGATFAGAQGGIFHPHAAPLVEALARHGADGVGQSSWGPAAYGVVGDPDRAAWIRDRVAAEVHGDVDLRVVDFDRVGATVEHA